MGEEARSHGTPLPEGAVVRWRVRRRRAHAYRRFAKSVFPHHFSDGADDDGLPDEGHAPGLASHIIVQTLAFAVLLAIAIILPFVALWALGHLFGHPLWLVTILLGWAGLLTLNAGKRLLLMTTPALSAPDRDRHLFAIRFCCVVSARAPRA